MNNNTIIIALKYEEPEWQQTWECLVKTGRPIIIADRGGIGSMAKAYNKHHSQNRSLIKQYKYVWLVSNITFDPKILDSLEKRFDECEKLVAVHPNFKSDHAHHWKYCKDELVMVPFVEFTAPLIKEEIFNQFHLDVAMPYWGHDLDWGKRVNDAGYNIAVDTKNSIQHTYIRYNKVGRTVTEQRRQLRTLWDDHTEQALINKYGNEWRTVLKYR
jgi:hypothetical protein